MGSRAGKETVKVAQTKEWGEAEALSSFMGQYFLDKV